MTKNFASPLSPSFTEQRQAVSFAQVKEQSIAFKLMKTWQDLIQAIGQAAPGHPPRVGGPGWNW